MCQEISKVTYIPCHHQIVYWQGELPFCLTNGHANAVHFVNSNVPITVVKNRECKRCQIADQLHPKDTTIPHDKLQELQEEINTRYAKTKETEVTELTETVKSNIAVQLGRPYASSDDMVELLKLTIGLPDCFDKASLVLLYSGCCGFLSQSEEVALMKEVRKGHFEQNLKQGLTLGPIRI
ncbi:hypothetical protein F5Y16DRAFT_402161 [Xylariaceae sp. FL0255]|nr:hypothetical protein F5Y16DRAFT_402161 [Xylariaceae sp. FL0255]